MRAPASVSPADFDEETRDKKRGGKRLTLQEVFVILRRLFGTLGVAGLVSRLYDFSLMDE